MTTWFRNVVVVVVLVVCVITGYFWYRSRDKTVQVPITPVVSNDIAISGDTAIDDAKEPVKEPVALTPIKPAPVIEALLPEGTDRFTVAITTTNADIALNLKTGGYVKDDVAFAKILDKEKVPVAPGAYKLSKEMTEAQVNKVLHGKPYMKWVVIKEGLRKEEIATLLASTLGWTSKQKTTWITKDTATAPEYTEGVYYPDTYLIPVAEDPSLVAKRLIAKFNEKFAPYLPQFTVKNIKWARALTLASIVQREAANNADMPLIAGILWNRLDQNIALGVDATLQYVRGDAGKGWWAPISVQDKQTISPFNTYKNKGLPPHPISNPGVSAIEAVLNPTKTDCIYYIHDKNRVTHCAVTYEEHQANIQKYLISPEPATL